MTTRVSDFHKVVVTSYKTAFLKSKSRVITCRNYILLNNNKFKSDLKNYFRVRKVSSYLAFEEIFLHVLQRHVPIKQV